MNKCVKEYFKVLEHIIKLFSRKIIPIYIFMDIKVSGNFNLKTKPQHIIRS